MKHRRSKRHSRPLSICLAGGTRWFGPDWWNLQTGTE